MTSVEEALRVKEQVEEELRGRPGVTGVDVGFKEVGGERTGEIAIRVHVEKKKKSVPKDQEIPAEIEGVKTDVIERKYELHPARVPVEEIELMVDAGTYDPVKGGIGLGPCRVVGGYVYVGTLGAVVRDNATNAPMLLSNFHVMCIDNGWHVGDTMTQPSRVDGGTCPAGVVGTLQRASLGGQVDCAVSSLSGRGSACEIVDIGAVAGTAVASLGQHVRKRGRTTGLTYGIVDSIAATVTIDYGDGIGNVTLTNQIGIAVDTSHSTQIGDHGDSGSVVVNDAREVVGLYFAGTASGDHGLANPIASVLSALNVSMCVGPAKLLKAEHGKELIKSEYKEFVKREHKELKVEQKELAKFEKLELEKVIKEGKSEFEKAFDVPFQPVQPVQPLQPFQPGQPGLPGVQPGGGAGEEAPQAGGNCDNFRTFAPTTGPNPLDTPLARYTVHEFGGAVPPDYRISTWGGVTGLNCGFELEIEVKGDPCPSVTVTLAHFAQAATIEAYNDDGSLAGTKTMTSAQRVEQTFTFSGKIRRVVVTSPSDECLLLEFCCGVKSLLKEQGKEKEILKREKLEKREKFEPKELKNEKLEKDKREKNEPKEQKPEKLEKDKHEKEKQEKNEPKEQLPKELSPKELSPKEQLPKEQLPKELSPKELSPKEQFPKELSSKELKPEKLELEGPQKIELEVPAPGPLGPGDLVPVGPGAAVGKTLEKIKPEKELREKIKPEKEAPEKIKPEKEFPEKIKPEKELKLEKLEPKESKLEQKELKQEKLEKDKHEKELKSEKELKQEPKEFAPKELKPEKLELEGPVKLELEGPGPLDPGGLFPGGPGWAPFGQGSAHFIGSELRPDLSQGALRQEEDLGG
jgi:hypothetical protein